MWENFLLPPRIRRHILLLGGLAGIVDTLILVAKLKINAGTLIPGLAGLILLFPVVLPGCFTRCHRSAIFRWGWRSGWCAGWLLLAGLPVFIVVSWTTGASAPTTRPAAILVLGAGLRDGDQPSPLLAHRLDQALQLADRACLKKSAKPTPCRPT